MSTGGPYPLFRTLSRYDGDRKVLLSLGLYHTPMNEWLDLYDARFKQNEASTIERHRTMRQANPKCVLKNHMLDEAIREAQQGDH